MYDELIKWLRDKETPWNLKDKHDEAADAIEQLLAENERLRLEVKHLEYLLRFK